MNINLFKTNTDELNAKLAGTTWQVNGVTLTVKDVYVDRWHGGYCARFTDNSWGRVATLLDKAQQVAQ